MFAFVCFLLLATFPGWHEEDDASGIPAGHVRIFLSTAYNGPGSEGFTGPAAYALAPTGTTSAAPSGDTITADGITCVN